MRRVTKRPARVVVSLCLLTMLTGVGVGCGGGQGPLPSPSGSPRAGGIYSFPLVGDPSGIEPLTAVEPQGMQVAHQVFQGLVSYELQDDGSLKAVPCIAESWTTNEDATEFVFKLRRGVLFQPPVEREVTAQDVVDSWRRVTDPLNQCPTADVFAPLQGCNDDGYQIDPRLGLTGAFAQDRYTLHVTLRYSFAEFPQALGVTAAAVVPVDHLERVGEAAFARRPVGTGPYMVARWRKGDAVDLTRNALYWDPESTGHVSRIHLPIVADIEESWRLFRAGKVDFTAVPSGQILAAQHYPAVAEGTWLAVKWPSLTVSFVGVDMHDPLLGAGADKAGLQLRQALTLATDRTAVIAVAQEGVPLPATGIVPPGVPGYRDGQSSYTFDPEEARTLVTDLDFHPVIDYWYPAGTTQARIAEALQAGWKTAGIDVRTTGMDADDLARKLTLGSAGGSQLFSFAWSAAFPSMDQFLSPLFSAPGAATGSFTFYDSTDVDEVLLQARATPDATQRRNLYAQAEKTILGHAPCIPLTFAREFRMLNTRAQGQVLDPMGFVDMWDVWVK